MIVRSAPVSTVTSMPSPDASDRRNINKEVPVSMSSNPWSDFEKPIDVEPGAVFFMDMRCEYMPSNAERMCGDPAVGYHNKWYFPGGDLSGFCEKHIPRAARDGVRNDY